MKVKLDLRPRSLVEAGGKRVNAKRVLLVILFIAFVMVGGVTFALTFLKVGGMRSDVSMLNDQVAIQQAKNAKMAVEIKRLAEVEAMYVSALKLLQEELPALEFMNSIETSLPLGVWVSAVTMAPGRATIRGSSYTEGDVVEFAKGLLQGGVAATVDFPVTTRVTRNNESLVDFTLSCMIRDLASISAGNAAEGGGER